MISAENFINTIFEPKTEDEAVCITHPKGDTFWNYYADAPGFLEFVEQGCYEDVDEADAWYVCISSVRPDGRASRKRADLIATYCIVLDDIGTRVAAEDVPLRPSWKMETSEGNFQWGYMIEPETDTVAVAAVIKWLADHGFSDPGAKSAARVVRVPGSRNLKDAANGWCSVLREWSPDVAYSLAEIKSGFGVVEADLAVARAGSGGAVQAAGAVNTTAGHAAVDPAEVASVLAALPEEWRLDHDKWIKAGQALYRLDRDDWRFAGRGLQMWTDWSAGADGYDGSACGDRWDGLVDAGDSELNPVTYGSLVYAAKAAGWSRGGAAAERVAGAGVGVAGSVGEDIRRFITAELVDMGFDAEALPVFWPAIDRAEPNCFVDNAGRQYLMRPDGSQVPVLAKVEAKIMSQEFGDMADVVAMLHYAEARREDGDVRFSSDTKVKEFVRRGAGVVSGGFWAAITRWKTVGSMNLMVDMFGSVMVPHVDRNVGTFVLPFKGLPVNVSDVADADCVTDYKAHNPWFDDILRFVLYSRFAVNRKNCYLWVQADSDWGKGLLFASTGVIGGMGLVQGMSVREIEMALEGKPVGVDKFSMIDQMVLWVDEFKGVKSEIKMLDNDITAAPKNMLRFTAPLYAKVFTSAEDVASLTGDAGVEDQFARRFSYIRGRGKLSSRAVFLAAGMYRYTGALRAYAREFMSREIERLQGLGAEAAANVAEVWLREWHDRHGLDQSFQSLDNTVDDEAVELGGIVRDFAQAMLAGVDGGVDVREAAVYRRKFVGVDEAVLAALAVNCEIAYRGGVAVVLLTRKVAVVDAWLKGRYDRSEIGKMAFKKRDMASKLDRFLFPKRSSSVTKLTRNSGSTVVTKGVVIEKLPPEI